MLFDDAAVLVGLIDDPGEIREQIADISVGDAQRYSTGNGPIGGDAEGDGRAATRGFSSAMRSPL